MLDRCCTAEIIGQRESNFSHKTPTHNGETRPSACYNVEMGNTVGSPSASFYNFPFTTEDYYILGLWCADGYHWSSSIGLSNIDIGLIEKFKQFLKELFPPERIKLHIYTTGKRTHPGYKLYVNSRPLLRIFKKFKEDQQRSIAENKNISAYFAGRFDGDGCISKDLLRDCRISYGTQEDALLDYQLLKKLGFTMTKLYRYRTSNTYVIYISTFESEKFVSLLHSHSLKLQKLALGPRRDSSRDLLEGPIATQNQL